MDSSSYGWLLHHYVMLYNPSAVTKYAMAFLWHISITVSVSDLVSIVITSSVYEPKPPN